MAGRRDRYGEVIDLDVDGDLVDRDPGPADVHDPRCRDGWLGEDEDGRLLPCVACRPHLLNRRAHLHRLLRGPQ